MMNELLVAINGPMGVGKSTVAVGLEKQHQFHIISIGTQIKKVSTLLIDDTKQLQTYLQKVLGDKEEGTRIAFLLTDLFTDHFAHAHWEKESNGSYNKNEFYRKLTQEVATLMRQEYGEDIWVRFIASDAMDLANEGKHVVCDDLRVPSEKRIFEQFGFTIIRLDISKEEQERRLKKIYGHIPTELLNHPTEIALNDATFDYRFLVDGLSEEQVQQKVYNFLNLTQIQ